MKNSVKDFILDLIKRAGKKLSDLYGKISDYEIKSGNPKDLVTTADRAIEEFIKKEIEKRFPSDTIIAEESKILEKTGRDKWYIDPIDGTTNFIRKIPFFGISIAYEVRDTLQEGAIHFPILKEIFHATRGKGAFKNDQKICVSSRNNIINSLLATGFACLRSNLDNNNLKNLNRILPLIHDIRRTGSACYDLCSVACGRFDGFWELNLASWDVKAGALLVNEAGGKVTDFDGKEDYIERKEILATNGLIHEKVLDLFRQI
ncbi:MAG: inositol monophosphatase [Spirochaetes bacterium]|nr:inositol monophosphatase [Spirochaetota bacterium]